MATETLSLRALNRATLARQLLLARERVPVVRGASSGWAACRRRRRSRRSRRSGRGSRGSSATSSRAALQAREVVRGTLMRGTLHLVSARDFCAFRGALQPVLDAGPARCSADRAEGLDVAAVLPVARTLLADGPRTFTELRALLLERSRTSTSARSGSPCACACRW